MIFLLVDVWKPEDETETEQKSITDMDVDELRTFYSSSRWTRESLREQILKIHHPNKTIAKDVNKSELVEILVCFMRDLPQPEQKRKKKKRASPPPQPTSHPQPTSPTLRKKKKKASPPPQPTSHPQPTSPPLEASIQSKTKRLQKEPETSSTISKGTKHLSQPQTQSRTKKNKTSNTKKVQKEKKRENEDDGITYISAFHDFT